MRVTDGVYEKSNSITKISAPSVAKKQYENVMASSEDIRDRQKRSQEFCDYLCKKFDIPRLQVKVVNRPQPHSNTERGTTKRKVLGTYKTGVQVITMYNLTAKQKKVVAIKTYTGVLLHEFIHHYDFEYLRLGGSPHTKGFYARLADLEKKCKKQGK